MYINHRINQIKSLEYEEGNNINTSHKFTNKSNIAIGHGKRKNLKLLNVGRLQIKINFDKTS